MDQIYYSKSSTLASLYSNEWEASI